ncbi:MAG: choice-of-anchor Q domain-containing protein [Pseudomonadota bacterium]
MKRILSGITLSLALTFATSNARAEIFCVGTPSALQNALLAAAGNSETDEIRLMVGQYLVPTANNGFRYVSSQPGGLTVSGGWGPPDPPDAPVCDSRKDNPRLTVIDGDFQIQGLVLQPGPDSGDIAVENLTITRGGANDPVISLNGGGIDARSFSPDWEGSYRFSTLIFNLNEATEQGAGLYVILDRGSLRLENSVFFRNAAGGDGGAAELLLNGAENLIANVTIAENSAADDGAGVRIGGNATVRLLNNVFADNNGDDLLLAGSSVRLNRNFLNSLAGSNPLEETGTLSGNPQLGLGSLGVSPNIGSPLIDAGLPVPDGLPPRDADGMGRIVGPAVDLGAYEAQIFSDGLEGDDDWIIPGVIF